MKKIETIWHHLLYAALEHGTYQHTQKDIAAAFDYSLSTVHHALRVPTEIGAIRKESKFFILSDVRKLLYYWASVRNLTRDMLASAICAVSVREIEGLAPPGSIFGGYTAATHILGEPPADYDNIHFYVTRGALPVFRKRFPEKKGAHPNVFALAMHPTMPRCGSMTTLPQTFVDIWNMHDWYARDFTEALERKMDDLLTK